MKNILLIGGAGFLGSNIITPLLQDYCSNVYVLEPEFAFSFKKIKVS